MTESEWLACAEPQPMLKFLNGKVSDRKLRLFAVACCSTLGHLLVPQATDLLSVAEQFADGIAGAEERKHAREKAFGLAWVSDQSAAHRRGPAKSAVCKALARRACEAAEGAARIAIHLRGIETDLGRGWPWGSDEGKAIHSADVAEVLRDIFGNPFRPVAVHPAWLTSDVLRLAEFIYQEKAFYLMPILAEALLQDAGCDNEEILNHCWQSGEHVRGCWVVDLLTGRK